MYMMCQLQPFAGVANVKAPASIATDRPIRRTAQLMAGLILFGMSLPLLVAAGLGLDSWDVLHQAIARKLGLSLGSVVNGVAVLVLVAWIPLRRRPGPGTVANAVLVGIVADAFAPWVAEPASVTGQMGLLSLGIVVNGMATGLYIGAGLGPGPRDGLMTGLAAVSGKSIRRVRTSIEIGVLALGWALGGTVGIGTGLFALSIGPLAQFFLGVFSLDDPVTGPSFGGRKSRDPVGPAASPC